MLTYAFDLDNTLCSISEKEKYVDVVPFKDRIDYVNRLYSEGHTIIIYTARGMGRFNGDLDKVDETYYNFTINQLYSFGVKFHKLCLGKESFDFLIDDKAINSDSFFTKVDKTKKGIIAGAFDVLHPGYIKMFSDINKYKLHLTVALHNDPSRYNNLKIIPLLSIKERKDALLALRAVDDVVVYETESDLFEILENGNFDTRFLGNDYYGKRFTGMDLIKNIVFLERDHGWSTTKFKTKIAEQINDFKN